LKEDTVWIDLEQMCAPIPKLKSKGK
jgi:hypothetical protein